jgi:AcrR family transcriptional regulator
MSGKRALNSAAIRERLYIAAAEIVAKAGFAGASISRMTERAEIAQGTFYNYFETREAIFDDMIVIFGKKLRNHIRSRVGDIRDFYERERIAFEAFFEFLHVNPFFSRVLNEAEIFTPDSHRQYFESILRGYREELTRASQEDQIRKLTAVEIEVISLMLMSARAYFALHYFNQIREKRKLNKNITETYMSVVRRSLSK